MQNENSRPSADVEESRARERASLAMEIPISAKKNHVRVIVLQHPQEPDKELGSAALLVRGLENASLRVGLSWKSLKAIAGESAIPSEWAVLYLGAKSKTFPEIVNFVNAKNELIPAPPRIVGLIVLDGTWSQAKALWWRNSWLTRLKRVVLRPDKPSRYGHLRREPRKEALSTIESVSLALEKLDPYGIDLSMHLQDGFQRMLDEFRARKKRANSPPAKP